MPACHSLEKMTSPLVKDTAGDDGLLAPSGRPRRGAGPPREGGMTNAAGKALRDAVRAFHASRSRASVTTLTCKPSRPRRSSRSRYQPPLACDLARCRRRRRAIAAGVGGSRARDREHDRTTRKLSAPSMPSPSAQDRARGPRTAMGHAGPTTSSTSSVSSGWPLASPRDRGRAAAGERVRAGARTLEPAA